MYLHSMAASSLPGAFLPLVSEKAFFKAFCTNDINSFVFFLFFYPAQGQVPICPVPLSLMELSVCQPEDPSLDFCQLLIVLCFGSWTAGLFLAKYHILIKMPLMRITLEPGIHLKSLQQNMNS